MSIDYFNKVFEKELKRFSSVYTGYSSYKEKCHNTICYGFDNSCAVFADRNNDRIIEHIWTSLFTINQNELELTIKCIQSLSKDYDLLYVDWAWGLLIPIDGSPTLFESVLEKTTEISKRMDNLS